MSPTYCSYHGWHDGKCLPGRRALTRIDFRARLSEIDAWLNDDEPAHGAAKTRELIDERTTLRSLLGGRA